MTKKTTNAPLKTNDTFYRSQSITVKLFRYFPQSYNKIRYKFINYAKKRRDVSNAFNYGRQ